MIEIWVSRAMNLELWKGICSEETLEEKEEREKEIHLCREECIEKFNVKRVSGRRAKSPGEKL